MNEKQIANYWYIKGVKDAETTERQPVELSQTLNDFQTHFEIQYESQKSPIKCHVKNCDDPAYEFGMCHKHFCISEIEQQS